jgi:predicted metal-binding protein
MNKALVIPVVDPAVRRLCYKAYPNHPKGCPNFDKKDGCPPGAPDIRDTLDFEKPIYAVWNKFPFGDHVRKMLACHPDWSHRQLECCLYWQGTARKQLREHINTALAELGPATVVKTPEAQGVNVTETMKKIGIELEWPPKEWAYQVALIGTPRIV